jgi:predicted dehydrogenase
MKEIRIGVIGLGNMGAEHARTILGDKVPHAVLGSVCDFDASRLTNFAVPGFTDPGELIRSKRVDAVVVATPHFSHTPIGIEALEAGLHVLMEKPISAHKADCERLIAAQQKSGQIFAAMFNQRTDPFYRKLRELITSGELGTVRRINWIITNWFRTDAYYASGGWRATWAGEGGGVLLNQCPHNLDLWQWLFGMPHRIRAHCSLGRYHRIEVEDDVTAYFEYPDGATGIFITSTGEAPGTNRLEVTADRGKIVIENDEFRYTHNEISMTEFNRTSAERFATPASAEVKIPIQGHGGQHVEILQNFVDAIRLGTELIAPAREGIHSVELANAMLYSSERQETLTLPLDASAYEDWLKRKIAASTFVKAPLIAPIAEDFAASFKK